MFSRTVSILLIAAVVACPLWCGGSLGHQCAAGECSQQVPRSEAASCCCCKETPRNGDDESPGEHPAESCQGICGGAVFEKSPELNGDQQIAFLRQFSLQRALFEKQGERGSRLLLTPSAPGGGNIGRLVRTLHMSILC